MASEVIKALFTAEENISSALDDIKSSSTQTKSRIDDLQVELSELGGAGQLAQDSMDDLEDAAEKVAGATKVADQKIEEINLTLNKLDNELISSDEAIDQLIDEFNGLITASESADRAIDGFESEIDRLAESGLITGRAADELKQTVSELGATSIASSEGIERIVRSLTQTSIVADKAADETTEATTSLAGFAGVAAGTVRPVAAVEEQVEGVATSMSQVAGASLATTPPVNILADRLDDMGDEASKASKKSLNLAGTLGILNSVTSSAAFQFGNLSVNIGPFNLGLQNVITQLPAILTGMTTLLALITSLIGAFVVLGAVTGALVVGGAIAFFEDFSEQFEETGEAVEALGAALKDLFVAAIQPIMTEANVDLFIASINSAAEVVNEFAQFVAQMRSEVLGFVDTIEVDLDRGFESMHDSFVLMQPVLRSFIEFFFNDMPMIITRFAQLTDNISGDIGTLVKAFGGLINELVQFASVVLAGLTPVVKTVVGVLIGLFRVLNILPSALVSGGIAAVALSIVLLKLISTIVGVVAAIVSLNGAMAAQLSAGSLLGSLYGVLIGAANLYANTNTTLAGALSFARAAMWKKIAASYASVKATIANSLATQVLNTTLSSLILRLKTSTAWYWLQTAASAALRSAKLALVFVSSLLVGTFSAEALAAAVAYAALTAYSVASSAAAAATWLLNAAIAVLTAPITIAIAAVLALVGALSYLANKFLGLGLLEIAGGVFGGMINWIQGVIDKLAQLIGFSGALSADLSGGVADIDDIETDPNVDLSFQESLEQNVDVQADPDDKAGLKRITKDAIEEANSFARRQQGTQ
jgi:hypothetical protein